MNPQDHKIFFFLDSINPHAIKTWVKRHQKTVDYSSESYIEIVGEIADTVIDRRLDKNTYEKFLPARWD